MDTTYNELRAALEIFGLSEQATLAEIKQRHRQLAKRYHPDHGENRDPAMMRRINQAHRIISNYVNNYSFSFSEAEFYRQNPEARLHRQFDGDPVWGHGGGQ